MTIGSAADDAVGAVALLGDPNRRRLYELVAASREPVGRDEAAQALGIGRDLAAFHLDRLVVGGLLEPEYRRLNGRSGPGAGRPAKLYRRAEREIAVLLPHRGYAAAAGILLDALDRMDPISSREAVARAAHARGATAGAAARRDAGADVDRARVARVLLDLLSSAGFEPQADPDDGAVRLRNCPYGDLAASHRELTCGMNHAWAQGVVEGLGDPALEAVLAPTEGCCCVRFVEVAGPPP